MYFLCCIRFYALGNMNNKLTERFPVTIGVISPVSSRIIQILVNHIFLVNQSKLEREIVLNQR